MELAHVWQHFIDLFDPIGYGWGPVRVHYTEIEAYARIRRRRISYVESQVIRDLSEKFCLVWSERRPEKPGAPGKGPFRKVEMTDAKGLRALFEKAGQKAPPKKKAATKR